MSRPILFALTLVTLGLATPTLAQEAMRDPCRSDDMVCRVDRLERTVAQMSERLSWYEGAIAETATGRAPRSVDVPVQSSCSGSGCSSVAAQTCRAGGFARGVPAAFSPDSAFMIRVTCMD